LIFLVFLILTGLVGSELLTLQSILIYFQGIITGEVKFNYN